MDAKTYIARIRNPAKKAYAERYWKFLTGEYDSEPPRDPALSYMAAQAVRLRLGELSQA